MTSSFIERKAVASLLLALIVLGSTACSGPEARLAKHMERGNALLLEGKLEKARVEFRNALQIAPNDAEARFQTGRVSEQLGNIREAAGMYQGAIDSNADHIQARANLGRLFVFAGAPDRAIEYVKPSLERHPDDADLLTVRAAAEVQLKNMPAALADAELAVRKAPDNQNALALLASLYRQQDQLPRAVSLLEAALKRQPQAIDLHKVLVSLYEAQGDVAAQERQLRALVALRPADAVIAGQYANFLVNAGRIDAAEGVMRDAVRLTPKDLQLKLALADFVARHRNIDSGIALLRDYGRKADDADSATLILGIAALQQRAGLRSAAVVTLQQVADSAESKQDRLAALNRIAALNVAMSQPAAARTNIARILEINPRDPDALALRGSLALDAGNAKSAIADLRAVLRDQPENIAVMRVLARAHLAVGERTPAEEALRTALQLKPTDAELVVEMATLLASSNRLTQAESLVRAAIERQQKLPVLHQTLVQLLIAQQKFDAARDEATELQTLAPTQPTGFFLAGQIALAQNRFADSILEFESALKIQPDSAESLAGLTRALLASGRSQQALERVNVEALRNPKNAAVQNLLGELLLSRKQWAEAQQALQAAIAAAPAWWLPYRNLAMGQVMAGRTDDAKRTYETGIAATKGEPALSIDLAALQERAGQFEDAIRTYEALHVRRPSENLAANNLAMLLVTYRKDAQSLARAAQLTAGFDQSDNASLLDTRGWVLLKQGDFTGALASLQRANAKLPDSKLIRFHLAMAQLRAGQTDAARRNLVMATSEPATFAGNQEARDALAELQRQRG